MPRDPENGATATETRIWEKEIDLYMRRKGYLTENKKVLYSLLLGQCTEGMKGRLCGANTWEAIKRGYDAIGLIGALRNAM